MRHGRYRPVVSQGFRSIAFAAALVAGCGGSEPAPEPPEITGPPKQRIAETVNVFFDAFNEGDAGVACRLLTERGKRLVVKITPQFQDLRADFTGELRGGDQTGRRGDGGQDRPGRLRRSGATGRRQSGERGQRVPWRAGDASG